SFGLGAVLDGDIRPAETVLVTGLGAIGQFAIQYCAAAGAHVVAASGFEERRRLARSLGAAEGHDTSAGGEVARPVKEGMAKWRVVKEDLVKEDLVKEGIDGVDVAIECSGSLTTLAMVIRAARQCGRIVCVGFYGAGTINLGEEFFHN